MASYGKYADFVNQLCRGKHDFGSHTFKVALSNGTPNASTHAVLLDITELTTANGYTTGGQTAAITAITPNVGTGTVTVSASDPAAWTASGSGITFRYAALYNDTATSPADALVAYWDYGSSVTVASGNTLQLDLGASVFTLG